MDNKAFDLSNVLAQASEVSNDQGSGGRQYDMKLVYPQEGELNVKLIFNQKSGVVMRRFERHTIGGNKIACLTNYNNMKCPVCEAIENINNATGADLWKQKRKTRGIAYAEYISSTYKWDSPNYAPQPGEIILLMFPWTIYQDISRIISTAGSNIDQLIASNSGKVFKITCWTEGQRIRYRAELDAFNQHQTRQTDEEYYKLVTDLPSLNDRIVPNVLDANIENAAKAAADELIRTYLQGNVAEVQPNLGNAGSNLGEMANHSSSSQNSNENGQFGNPATDDLSKPEPQRYEDPVTHNKYIMINGQWVPDVQSSNNTANNQGKVQTNPAPGFMNSPESNDKPSCFGQYNTGKINRNQCMLCMAQGDCMNASN